MHMMPFLVKNQTNKFDYDNVLHFDVPTSRVYFSRRPAKINARQCGGRSNPLSSSVESMKMNMDAISSIYRTTATDSSLENFLIVCLTNESCKLAREA